MDNRLVPPVKPNTLSPQQTNALTECLSLLHQRTTCWLSKDTGSLSIQFRMRMQAAQSRLNSASGSIRLQLCGYFTFLTKITGYSLLRTQGCISEFRMVWMPNLAWLLILIANGWRTTLNLFETTILSMLITTVLKPWSSKASCMDDHYTLPW